MLLQLHEPGQTPLPHQENRCIVGIDLGTTHSLVAHYNNGKVTVLVDKTPSVVAYDGHTFHVGHEALNHTHAVHSVKRFMAHPAHSIETTTGTFTPLQASAAILNDLKHKAEKALGASLKEIVLTVPAYFDDTARTATRDAARMAGLEVVRMLNEPTAAALAYGLEKEVQGLYGVYDLGGGTFDFSLLELNKGVFQVLATGGDTQLGGDDVDQALQTLLPEKLSPMDLRHLKETLSQDHTVTHQDHVITRDRLEVLCDPLITKTLDICENVMKDAQKHVTDLKGLVLVGGATRMPLVQKKVEAYFKQKPFVNINPDEAVALGAAYQAHALATGTGTLLLDVCPLSLGLEMMGGTVDKFIPRNSPIPTSVSQEFTTYQDGQTALLIHVVQGERDMVADCRSLAKFVLNDIPPAPQGYARIDVTFTLDADGLLSVSAQEKTTGIMQSIEVKPTYGLTSTDIDHLIEMSYTHALEDKDQKEKQETKIEAIRLCKATQAALETDGDLLNETDKETISATLKEIQKAIEEDHVTHMKTAMDCLKQATHAFAEKRLNRTLSQAFKGKSL